MFEEQTGTPIEQIVILVVTEDGVVQEFVKNKYDYIPLLVEFIDNFTKDWEEENDKLDRLVPKDYLSSMVDSYKKKYAYLSVNGVVVVLVSLTNGIWWIMMKMELS